MIEIDTNKFERGTHEGRVKYTRGGKTFYRNQRVGRKESEKKSDVGTIDFIPAKSIDEAIIRFDKYADSVEIEYMKLDELNSVLRGFETIMGQYDLKIGRMGEFLKTKEYGSYYRSGKGIEEMGGKAIVFDSIMLNANRINNVHTHINKSKKIYESSKKENLEESKKILDDPNSSDIILDFNKRRYNRLESSKRWCVCNDVDDPIYAIILHECWHAVFFKKDFQNKWDENLKLNNVKFSDKYAVSDYGASDKSELFAEVGAAIGSGLKIPDNIKQAFKNTVEVI